ncbi:hypothetical protein LSAT2_007252 [Lamellibrachia satsuma]|nr:hypothetical protein LSAT2_007252 [Lamellibrachia satsuma]
MESYLIHVSRIRGLLVIVVVAIVTIIIIDHRSPELSVTAFGLDLLSLSDSQPGVRVAPDKREVFRGYAESWLKLRSNFGQNLAEFSYTGSTNTSLDARTTPPAQHNIEDPKDTGTNNPEPPMMQTENNDARNTNGHQVSKWEVKTLASLPSEESGRGKWEVENIASLPSEESGRLIPLPPSAQRKVED